MGDQANLGVGLTLLEVVVANLQGFDVGPLGRGINNVFLQLDVGQSTVAVVSVLNITVSKYVERDGAAKIGGCAIATLDDSICGSSTFAT